MTRRIINKVPSLPILIILVGVIIATLMSAVGPHYFPALTEQIEAVTVEPRFDQSPYYVGTLDLGGKGADKIPGQILLDDTRLLISYKNSGQIDVYDERFKKVRTIDLESNHPLSIDAISASESKLFISDLEIGEIRNYDMQGTLLSAWTWLPDQNTRMTPLGIKFHQGILYATDTRLKELLAISVEDITGVKETGELLYAKPLVSKLKNDGIPRDLAVTPDGRIMIADSELGEINVYTCMGDHYYRFSTASGPSKMLAPNSLAFDDIQSPDLLALADSIFDPSMVLYQGRVHVTDARTGRVKIFDNQGKYVLTYGQELGVPEDIAINTEKRLILISDSEKRNVAIYKYG